MKKSILLTIMFAILMIFSTAAYADISLNPAKLTINKGKTSTINVQYSGDKSEIKWSTSDKAVATVNKNGKVTAVHAGQCTISATADGKTVKCTVTVPGINIDRITLYEGETVAIKLFGTKIKSVRTDDKKVVVVNCSGIVTAKAGGKAKITIIGKNKKQYKCIVTVKTVKINNSKLTLKEGESAYLKLIGSKTNKVYSDDTSVAKINNNGIVVAMNPGKAMIYLVGENRKKYKCVVTVTQNSNKESDLRKSVMVKYRSVLEKNDDIDSFCLIEMNQLEYPILYTIESYRDEYVSSITKKLHCMNAKMDYVALTIYNHVNAEYDYLYSERLYYDNNEKCFWNYEEKEDDSDYENVYETNKLTKYIAVDGLLKVSCVVTKTIRQYYDTADEDYTPHTMVTYSKCTEYPNESDVKALFQNIEENKYQEVTSKFYLNTEENRDKYLK